MKDKESFFHLKADIGIGSNDNKTLMKEFWVETLRFLKIHIFKDRLLKNVDRGKEPKLFQDET